MPLLLASGYVERQQALMWRSTRRGTYPQVSVGQVGVVVSRVGAVDGLLAVDLDDATVLDVPRVLQLVEDVTGLIFDEQRGAGRP